MSIRKNFVSVHTAAEILGVARNTIRAWGAAGKIPEYRHPMIGYHFYKPRELQKFLKLIEKSRAGPKHRGRAV